MIGDKKKMPENTSAPDYDAVLAELYAKRDEIDVSINTILFLKGSGSATPSSGVSNSVKPAVGGTIPSNAFFSMSLVDAAKKCIELKQAILTRKQIVKGLEDGGMPSQKPNSVYAALRRRESVTGDIMRVGEEWGLKEWFSGISAGKSVKPAKAKKGKKKKSAKKTAAKSVPPAQQAAPQSEASKRPKKPTETQEPSATKNIKIVDAAYKILTDANVPLHAELLVEKINGDYGKNTNVKSIAATLPGDSTGRFFNTGNNTWALTEWKGTDRLQP